MSPDKHRMTAEQQGDAAAAAEPSGVPVRTGQLTTQPLPFNSVACSSNADESSGSSSSNNNDRRGGGSDKDSSNGGEGYSADCSASDQSSDETSRQQRRTTQPDKQMAIHKVTTNHHHRHHHHHHQKQHGDDRQSANTTAGSLHVLCSSVEQHQEEPTGNVLTNVEETSAGLAAVAAASNGQLKKPPPSSCDQSHQLSEMFDQSLYQRTQNSDEATTAAAVALPPPAGYLPYSLAPDLAQIQSFKPQQDAALQNLWQQYHPPPQHNGVKIKYPMDPRIDVSTVQLGQNVDVPWKHAAMHHAAGNPHESLQLAPDDSERNLVHSYEQLSEAVKPFYQTPGTVVAVDHRSQPHHRAASSDEPPSNNDTSEGFTSFFTTTHSSCGQNNTDSSLLAAVHARSLKAKQEASSRHVNQQPSSSSDVSFTAQKRPAAKAVDASAKSASLSAPSHPDPPAFTQPAASSSSSDPPSSGDARQNDVPSRIVTDTSSGRNTDGSGSGGGPTSTSGGGSNPESSQVGSSGSGNDLQGGSGSNSAGSSEEVAEAASDVGAAGEAVAASVMKDADGGESDKALDQKLADKKRKRIEMRREYEAQQEMDSSERCVPRSSHVWKPAKPVALEQALGFSTIARMIIQAVPPFTIVHTNASWSRMTGIDAHSVVGKPISSILRVPITPGPNERSSGSSQGKSASQRVREAKTRQRSENENLERIVIASGFGQRVFLNVRAKQRMVGCSVRVSTSPNRKPAPHYVARKPLSDQDESDSSAATFLNCVASIAPVISPDESSAKQTGQHGALQAQLSKRKKHNPEEKHTQPMHQLVTHYIVQLESREVATGKQGSVESLSSSSISAVQRDSKTSDPERPGLDQDGVGSETTTVDSREPLTAIG